MCKLSFANISLSTHLSLEHSGELFGDPLVQLLDGGGVADEGGGHGETSRGDVTHSSLDVVWDPLHEVGRVLVLGNTVDKETKILVVV